MAVHWLRKNGGSAYPTKADHQLQDKVGQALSPVSAFFRSL
jgi:hypothetical protein